MKIQPITTWQNGEAIEANNFLLTSTSDNLATSATFSYQLQKVTETVVPATETEPETIITSIDNLITGYLFLDGADYQTWDSSVSANEWAYNWAAGKLNLVIIPDQVFA